MSVLRVTEWRRFQRLSTARGNFSKGLIDCPERFYVCDNIILTALHRINKGLYFVEIALGMDLIVGECGSEVVARVEVFDDSVTRTDFLVWDAEDSGRVGLESQFFHLL